VLEVAKAPPLANGPSNSLGRGPVRPPKSRRWSKRTKILLASAVAGLIVCSLAGAGYVVMAKPFRSKRADLVTHTVGYGRLELTIVERGFLESAKNTDIVCRVKARTQNTQTSTTIKWVIDEGSHVVHDRPREQVQSIIVWDPKTASYIEKPGNPDGTVRVMEVKDPETGRTVYSDLLVDLDESGLQEQLKDQKIVMDKAESDWVQAQQAYKIDEEKYKSDKKTAETNLELARIDLEKYQKGDFPQSLKDLDGKIKQAESDAEQQRDRAAWAQRMLKKGYYTVSQSDAEQSKLQSLELNLGSLTEQKRVLVDPQYGLKKRTETDYRNKMDVAALALKQVEAQWVATEVKDRTDRDTKKSIYDQGVAKYDEIKAEIKKCKLCAPSDGLVVYYVPEQTRWGVGRQAIIAQSEAVAENQKLMQIPDLAHMFVNTKVHEALVSRVHKGQPAAVRVDAAADRRLKAHVESVANTASQQDFFAADVKTYATKVMIDEELDNLKPGMQAEVTITIADALEHVLTVPIEAVVGAAEMGKTRKVFVLGPNGPEEREVVVGMSNDKEVEIRDGLKEGDEVVLNPRAIVGDKAKVHQPGAQNGSGEQGQGQAANGERQGNGGTRAGRQGNGGPGGEQGPGGRPGAGAGRNGGPSAPGATGGGPGGPGAGQGSGGFQMTPEQMKEIRKKLVSDFKALTPEKRKERLEKIPEQWRENVRKTLKDEGIDVPN
jgi:multidrug resistance efflux pump